MAELIQTGPVCLLWEGAPQSLGAAARIELEAAAEQGNEDVKRAVDDVLMKVGFDAQRSSDRS